MAVLWLVVGSAVGALNGLSRWWTVARLRPGVPRTTLVLVLGGVIQRWGLATGLLIAALRRGIVPGLLAFAGLWLARWGAVIWVGFGRRL